MPTHANPDPIRSRLATLIERAGEEMAGLSRMIGRPPGYVSAYLRGRPKVLPERERALLARYFGRHEADMLPLSLRDARREQLEPTRALPRPTFRATLAR